MKTANMVASVNGDACACNSNDIKKRMQATWASGDFSLLAARTVHVAEQLCETADLQAGWHVLDVATGSGNAAIAAAQRECHVVGVDFVPALLARGRERAAAERLDVKFVEGDAEQLPIATGSMDAVLSVFGAMFAPDHQKAAAELLRVCRPGGKIVLASWTPGGFIGEVHRTTAKYAPPAGMVPPDKWGEEAHLARLFNGAVRSMRSDLRTAVFRGVSLEAHFAFINTNLGPALKTRERLSPPERDALTRDLMEVARRHNRNRGGGPIALESEYLETVIVKA